MTWSKPKDVVPGLRVRERDLIRGDTYDRPIFSVDLFDVVDDLTPKKRPYVRKARSGPGTRPREVGERVEVEVVDDLVEGTLLKVSLCRVLLKRESGYEVFTARSRRRAKPRRPNKPTLSSKGILRSYQSVSLNRGMITSL